MVLQPEKVLRQRNTGWHNSVCGNSQGPEDMSGGALTATVTVRKTGSITLIV